MAHTKVANQIKLLSLTPLEREVIAGGLIGDGTLVRAGKHYRFKVEHSNRQKPYVEWKYNLLKRLCLSGLRYDLLRDSWAFRTVGHPELTSMRHEWYRGSKEIPQISLTPRMIAMWLMDDGTKHRDTVNFSVYDYSISSIRKLQYELSCYGIETTLNGDSKGNRLRVRKRSYEVFKKLVNPYIHKCMSYKLS